MKIALCSSMPPFIGGGTRNIVEWLELVLREHGHEVERIYLPHADSPEILFRQMAAYRWVDLSAADRIICFRPPAHVIPHPQKVIWFIHHIREFYDLWDTPLRDFPDDQKHRGIRNALDAADTAALNEATAVFANSRVVADRLRHFNGVEAEVLYPPIYSPERFGFNALNDEIVAISHIARLKRQHLLVEAMRFTTTDVRLRICGASMDPGYLTRLRNGVRDAGLGHKVTIEDRWIGEDEKTRILANCLALAYVPLDEDSYGYATLEAAHSSKATITASDSGGLLEFVETGVSGIVAEPTPEALAEAMDAMFRDRGLARTLGQDARARVDALNITWTHVVERILA